MLSASSPFSFILFGASGHLAKIKIYPALYVLALKDRLPKDYVVMGYSRTEMSDEEFRKRVEESIREEMAAVTEPALEEFLKHCYYTSGQYDNQEDYQKLGDRLNELEKGWKDHVRVTYYSVPPNVFPDISHNLCAGNVHDGKIPFRCIVEKPVGSDLKSFEEVQKQLLGCFQQEEIYLLDHYLGKEAVRNIYYLRYANPVLERIFKNTLIDHVEITAFEDKGLEGRAGFFEHTGTFRDFFQSHLLMMMSLLTMRLQETGDSFQAARLDALKQLYLPPASDMSEVVVQGQYGPGKIRNTQVPGYMEEEGIEKGSRTNTYAALKLLSRTSRWQGVPFYLRSGKRLAKKETRVSIQFQEPRQPGKGSAPNRLDMILQGEAGMRFHMQTKLGGTEPEFRPLVMEDPLVCVGDCLPEHGLLLLEAINGNHQWYLSFEEIRESWKLIDPLQSYLDNDSTPLHVYESGSFGPKEADEWIERDDREWFNE